MLKPPRYYGRVDSFLNPTHINEKKFIMNIHYEKSMRSNPCFFFFHWAFVEAIVHCSFTGPNSLWNHIWRLHFTQSMVYKALECCWWTCCWTKTWHWPTLGFCASCSDLSPLSLSLLPFPLCWVLCLMWLARVYHWVLQKRLVRREKVRGSRKLKRNKYCICNKWHSWLLAEFLFIEHFSIFS